MTVHPHDLPLGIRLNLLSAVSLFQLYRLFLVFLLISLYFTGYGPVWLGYFSPRLFGISSFAYLALIISGIAIRQITTVRQELHTPLMIFIDIIFITLILHASGGVQTGLGLLLAISVTAGSLMMRGRLALLFAALASMALLAQQLSAHLQAFPVPPDFVQSALLGLSFFAIALLAHSLSLHLDASEKKALKTQQDLNSMAQLSEYVIQEMQQGVIAVDLEGNIRLLNSTARKMLDLDTGPDHLSIERACPELAKKISLQPFSQKRRVVPSITLPRREANQQAHHLRATLLPLGAAKAEGTLVFIEDQSDINQRAQELKLAAIGRLTASIAHEIRNPLGAIGHAGQLLGESDALQEADKRLTRIISNNVQRVNQTIENVLGLSRRDSARPDLVEINSWLDEIRSQILQATVLQPEQVAVQVTPGDAVGFFDKTQLDQVLTILVNNAITHFPGPVIALRVVLQCMATDEEILLSCLDNGSGIAPEISDEIFEPFYTTQQSGTGLGLYLARELVESNQGKITYERIEPHGSHFNIILRNSLNDAREQQ